MWCNGPDVWGRCALMTSRQHPPQIFTWKLFWLCCILRFQRYHGADNIPICSPLVWGLCGGKPDEGRCISYFFWLGRVEAQMGVELAWCVFNSLPAKLIDDKWKEAAVDTMRHRNKTAVHQEWTFCNRIPIKYKKKTFSWRTFWLLKNKLIPGSEHSSQNNNLETWHSICLELLPTLTSYNQKHGRQK